MKIGALEIFQLSYMVKFALGKNWVQIMGQLLWSGSKASKQCDKILTVHKILEVDTFNSRADLGYVNGLQC